MSRYLEIFHTVCLFFKLCDEDVTKIKKRPMGIHSQNNNIRITHLLSTRAEVVHTSDASAWTEVAYLKILQLESANLNCRCQIH